MLLQRLQAVILLLSAVHFLGLYAYPTINIPFLLTSSGFGDSASRYKKSGFNVQTDADVAELEHLRENYGIANAEETVKPIHVAPQTVATHSESHDVQVNAEQSDLSQELERQLEQMPNANAKPDTATIMAPTAPTALLTPVEDTQPEEKSSGMHRPPTLPHDNGGKAPPTDNGIAAQAQAAAAAAEHSAAPVTSGGSPPAPSVIKPFYGAARLAFGQNPEVLPTTTTTSTSTASTTSTATSTSTSTSTTSTTPAPIPTVFLVLPSNILSGDTKTTDESSQTVGIDTVVIANADADADADEDVVAVAVAAESAKVNLPEPKGDAEVEDVSHLSETVKLATRRSVTLSPSKTVENLLKRRNGQLSPFDMAQYVFWTGDEAGVARAVEELIDRRLLSRENALKFLREVRLGIEYLQQSYTNRIFPEAEFNINMEKKAVDMPTAKLLNPIPVSTEKPFMPYLRLERPLVQDNENAAKALENLSVWHKLLALNNDNGRPQVLTMPSDLNDYDDTVDRAKVSQFLYKEYTLEDILYKLAKIMFTQSLAHGSDEAQHELQRLTDFLEREGNLGVIPIDLQKKVLHILFRALSDTLAERPELLPVASINLASPYNRLPIRTLEP